ncbi:MULTISPECIES: PhnD/SsuA/transferrin family substrate-binding protein [Chelatococcus]|uniref:Phosphonate transport system substrate-binding protein n=1 Tax=Chelatococcus caeni TaxID=1348468 RepID=A0A840BTS5_9HYPH|nr:MULTISPECIES: PhnD/SsuA/transferrin family substrate-binding protein [Chelatococcus]ALA19099.1 phosphonate ABC transporter substrate-binding protein [Chelatococcus sp. CO-6]MBB4016380.1 phosphonate transport system substrate-binding protein [Chelatococcus caeni]
MLAQGSASPDRRRVLAAAAAVLLARGAQAGEAAPAGQIRFGLTPVFLNNDLELLGRLQGYLERATGHPVSLITRRTYQEITALLTTRQIDAAWICGYPFVTHRSELQLVAVPLWRSRPLYQSYVIVGSDSEARDVSDLAGGIHAFSDPDSNSGFLVTRALLAEMGLRPERFFARAFFTYGHRNVIRAVASGLAGSGSVDGYVYEVMAQIEPELTGRTRVLRRSEWLAFPPVAAPRTPLDEIRLAKLAEALLAMPAHLDGRAVLAMLRLDGFAREEASLFDAIAAKVDLLARAG